MAGPRRADERDSIYHALIRGNSRSTIFHKDADYVAFENTLAEGHHFPPGYSALNNLPTGRPGEYYPGMPPDPVMYPVEEDAGSVGDENQS